MSNNLFSKLPSMEKLLHKMQSHFPDVPTLLLKDKINIYLEHIRQKIKTGSIGEQNLKSATFENHLKDFLYHKLQPNFKKVINGTGVIIHTNLGRSLLAKQAIKAVTLACNNYSNLEFNLETGQRGSRYAHVEELLCLITGAQAALVVNNNAAAVLIVLETLAKNKEVIVSRGELVEIGGSFRIPDVMAKSGAILKEIGTTNRTHLKDYKQAINENTAALMKVHTSNYRILGFYKSVSLSQLASLAKEHHLPLIEDMGSGNLLSFAQVSKNNNFLKDFDEPTVQESIRAGVDVISFSGDKLLGGPQAGIIVGQKKFIDQIKTNPLNRAVRIDKMTLAALEATLRLYLDLEKALTEIPTLKMIFISPSTLKNRATKLAHKLKQLPDISAKTCRSTSKIGGGSLPETTLPTYLVQIKIKNLTPEQIRKKLLQANPPIIGRIENDIFCLDVRCLLSSDLPIIVKIFKSIIRLDN
ncbi:MAG: L-seryl-tRNA(Sec) selenium transferase [Desulfonauticus sp.]|nr:L-seryl-tRNA(Sec) selenium transferase [Desulfonauticus sp.]